jgi:hypothetical protein
LKTPAAVWSKGSSLRKALSGAAVPRRDFLASGLKQENTRHRWQPDFSDAAQEHCYVDLGLGYLRSDLDLIVNSVA